MIMMMMMRTSAGWPQSRRKKIPESFRLFRKP